MQEISIYTVDAFTDTLFCGNTCAVCLFPGWPEDQILQNVAAQNLFAETAFINLSSKPHPELRWFTVSQEVGFCGYGTLSAGYVYLNHINPNLQKITFSTRHYGLVPVKKRDNLYTIEVHVKKLQEPLFDEAVHESLGGTRPLTMIKSERGDLIILYANELDLIAISPDFPSLMKNHYHGYVLTSPSKSADYAYRYFSPRMPNVWEDPVNGASQSALAPYWVDRLGKSKVHGQAASRRGGDVYCEFKGGSTLEIGGKVAPYLHGRIVLG